MSYSSRPAKVVVDLAALQHNYRLAQQWSGDGQVIAVIKADAYGHGSIQVAQALSELTPAFAVACIEEALTLRVAGITQPILLLEGAFKRQDLDLAAEHNFWVMVGNHYQLECLSTSKLSKPIVVWIKLDTGMHRLGFCPQEVNEVYQQLCECRQVDNNIVLTSHFACADELDNDFTSHQIALFDQHQSSLHCPASLANSAGILGWPQARRDWDRAGLMLYGISPFDYPHPLADKLKPVMSLQSEVISVCHVNAGQSVGYGNSWQAQRNSVIATVAMGYADGYPRAMPSGTPVLINGQIAPLAGRVSMDMLGVDVTDIAPINIGDPVTLWGTTISVNKLASRVGSSSYELLAGMPARVPRIYA